LPYAWRISLFQTGGVQLTLHLSDVSVVIPHAGDADLLERCLASLTSDRIREVIVVVPEQASASLHVLERHPRARTICVPRLLSFARATNLGARFATSGLLLMLNDDAAVEGKAIERIADTFDEQPRHGALGAFLVNPDGSPQPSVYTYPSWRALGELMLGPLFRGPPLHRFARFPYTRPPQDDNSDFWLSGAALMVRRELFAEVGGLDEAYPHGVEDALLCRAIRSRGYGLAVVEDARVLHDAGMSGYRSRASSEQVSRALVGGATGWIRYWETNGAGSLSRLLLRIALLLFGFTRLVVYSIGSVLPGPHRSRQRVQRNAYAVYMRSLLSRCPGNANGARS
jgi:GT2 family glycosyltransferase